MIENKITYGSHLILSEEKLCFVCVSYNNSSFTVEMCNSLLAQTGFSSEHNLQIYVIDNSSDSDEIEILKKYCCNYAWITYVPNSINVGYFAGLNIGLDLVDKEKSKYIVICNNDLKFSPDFCRLLLDESYDDNVFAICPDVITVDGVHQNPHHLKPLSRIEIFSFDLYFSHYYIALALLKTKQLLKSVRQKLFSYPEKTHDYTEINQGVGACYILSPQFFESNKKLFYPHFLYGEEAFFSWQVRSSGGKLLYNPNLVVFHAESASLSKLPGRVTYRFGQESYRGLRRYLS